MNTYKLIIVKTYDRNVYNMLELQSYKWTEGFEKRSFSRFRKMNIRENVQKAGNVPNSTTSCTDLLQTIV